MIVFEELRVKTPNRETLIEISDQVTNVVRKSNVKEGICRVFIPHTTAGITINENADPSVIADISNFLDKLIPKGGGLGYRFKHMEGNSDAYIKCSLTGHSEYDGPRNRKVYIQITGEES